MAGVWCHLWHVSVLVHHTLFKMSFLQRRMEVAVSSAVILLPVLMLMMTLLPQMMHVFNNH